MRKKILAALLAVCMIATMLTAPAAAASTFTDVDGDHWAAESIDRWAGHGVVTGHGDGTFAPDDAMKRGEFASFIVNLMGYTEKADISAFTDVDPNMWYADPISKAVAAKIMNGKSSTVMGATDEITFSQANVMLARALGLVEIATDGSDMTKAIEVMTEKKMIGAEVDEHLTADASFTRATMAKLADNAIAYYVDKDEEITGEVTGVIVVVNGAKADIKDATVTSPIVVMGGTADVTGESKVETIKVGGDKSSVTVADTATVEAVVVEAGATEPVVNAPADKVDTSNATSNVTVNGETVEVKPADPDNGDNTDNSEYPGSVEGGGDRPSASTCKHDWVYTAGSGTHTAVCAICGDTMSETACVYTASYVFKSAGAVGTGKHTAYCVCGNSQDENHSADDSCDKCDYTVTITNDDTVPAHTHTWDGGSVTTAATCSAEGVKTYTCTATTAVVDSNTVTFTCGATKTEPVAKTSHTFGEWSADTATCGAAGSQTRECGVCHTTETKTTLPTGSHNTTPGEGETLTYNMTNAGHIAICLDCGKPVSNDVTPHTVADAGWVSNGVDSNHKTTCKVCGFEYTGDHNWKAYDGTDENKPAGLRDAVAATCAADGWAADSYCTVCNQIKRGATISKGSVAHDGLPETSAGWTDGKATCSTCHVEVTCNHGGVNPAEKDPDTWTCSTCGMAGTCTHARTTNVAAVAGANCLTAGTSAGVKCAVCQKVISGCEAGQGPVGEHNFGGTPSGGKVSCQVGGCSEQRDMTAEEKAECAKTHEAGETEAACPKCGVTIPAKDPA